MIAKGINTASWINSLFFVCVKFTTTTTAAAAAAAAAAAGVVCEWKTLLP